MAHLADGGDSELEVTKEHIGKLVCISGTQIGKLRYIGYTKFQQGIWCGIELDTSVGKNDGSVNGHRYFQCKEMYGIFAPVAKVVPVIGNDTLSVQKYASSTLCLMEKSEPEANVISARDKLVLELQSLEISAGPASPTSLSIPAPATTPVQANANEYELFKNGKRLKKERGKYAAKPNEEQQQKKRKLDSDQKCWSASAVMKCPTSLLDSLAPHLARFTEEIKSSGETSSPLHSPPRNYNDAFSDKVPTSTPSRKLRQRLLESLHGSAEEDNGEESGDQRHQNLSLVTEEIETSCLQKEDVVAAPLKRPNCIGLPPGGLSSEESSELGIFGVSTPELIGGDGTSLAMSFPTSCCSSPEALDNESSLGLLTPSQLQDCWNSNTNEEDLYQHLRSPSVDDLEEFEEEKTVDQDLSSATYSYGSHGCSFMSATVVSQTNLVPNDEGMEEKSTETRPHPPLSLRGSGSGYCGSDPLTDSDFNTESEADHDEKSSVLMPQNRNARVIDGNLYTSHLSQSTCEREAKKRFDILNSDMESSGFYSDSERNPFCSSTESTTSGEMFQRRGNRGDHSKVTHNEMHPHRQQHYSSSSQQSEEPESHYRDCQPITIISDDHEEKDLAPTQDSKGETNSLEKFIADELDHEKCALSDKTLTAADGDSCQSSSSSSSQVLRQIDSQTEIVGPPAEATGQGVVEEEAGVSNQFSSVIDPDDKTQSDTQEIVKSAELHTPPFGVVPTPTTLEIPDKPMDKDSPVTAMSSRRSPTGGESIPKSAPPRNTTLSRKNVPATDSSKSVEGKIIPSRLASANKVEQGSARTESRRNKIVVSKTDSGKGGKTCSSTKENSGLSSTNRSVGGSHKSLAGLGTDPKNTVAAAAKKLNKWDAVMSKIDKNKNKTIDIKNIRSKVYNSVTQISNISTAQHGKSKNIDKSGTPMQPNHFSSKNSASSSDSLDTPNVPSSKPRLKTRQISEISSASDASQPNQSGRRNLKPESNLKATDKVSINSAQDSKKRHQNITNKSGIRNSESSPNTNARKIMRNNTGKANSAVIPLKDRNRVNDPLLPENKQNQDPNSIIHISQVVNQAVQTDNPTVSIVPNTDRVAEFEALLSEKNTALTAIAVCVNKFHLQYLSCLENGEISRRKGEYLLDQKNDQLTQLEDQIKCQNHEWEQKLSLMVAEKQNEIQSIRNLFVDEKDKLKADYESKLEAIRLESDQNICQLKLSHQSEIENLIAENRLKLEDYKKKSANQILCEEVRSLEIVVEMRNDEIRKLKEDLFCHAEVKNSLLLTKEQNKNYLAKVEDCEAQISKLKTEKVHFQEKLFDLESNFTQLESENTRLSQYNEELSWRLQTLRTDERLSLIMSKSATELGLSAGNADLDLKSSVNALLSCSRTRHSNVAVVESILNGPQYQSTPNAGFASFNHKKKHGGFLSDDTRQLNKSLDEADLRNTLNGFRNRRENCDRLVSEPLPVNSGDISSGTVLGNDCSNGNSVAAESK